MFCSVRVLLLLKSPKAQHVTINNPGIETDKAEIDVEAQDDGILGKILKQDGEGNIPVGQPIAFLAEEGDDLSQIPNAVESSASSGPSASSSQSQQQQPPSDQNAKSLETPGNEPHTPSHNVHSLVHGLKPSVQRLLLQSSKVSEADIRDFISRNKKPSKGDTLAFLGQIPSAYGSLTEERKAKISMSPYGPDGKPKGVTPATQQQPVKLEPMTAKELRNAIIAGMAAKIAPKKSVTVGKPAGTGLSIHYTVSSILIHAAYLHCRTERDYDELFASYLPPPPAKAAEQLADTLARKNRIAPLPGKDPLNDLFVS